MQMRCAHHFGFMILSCSDLLRMQIPVAKRNSIPLLVFKGILTVKLQKIVTSIFFVDIFRGIICLKKAAPGIE